MRVLITGAGGFVGTRLIERLLAHAHFAQASISLFDSTFAVPWMMDPRLTVYRGDLRDPAMRLRLVAQKPDVVFHLAGALGGAAETNYPLSREVNVDATLSLLEALRNRSQPPRIVFTSSIAVFGPMSAEVAVTDDTRPIPLMTYGAQKLMMETALVNFSAREEIDGISLRLPGVIARPDADERMKSSFLHRLIYAYRGGMDVTLPVSASGTSWLISVPACVEALIHAALLPPQWDSRYRAFVLPAQRVMMRALVHGLAEAFPESKSRVEFVPDPMLDAQFASQPPLVTAAGDRLGFKHDGSVIALIRRATEPGSCLTHAAHHPLGPVECGPGQLR